MNDIWIQNLVTIIATFIASGGFWAYIQKRTNDKSATTRLLMGLAYDRITVLGMEYIERGWITNDEYEDFQKYFYEPYKAFGGNGSAERIMLEVGKLPFKSRSLATEVARAKLNWKENGDE